LAGARDMSHCDKGFDQPGVFRGFEGLLHGLPNMRIDNRKSDPKIGLSQKRIILTETCHMWAGRSGSDWTSAPKGAHWRD
jgi:hypothetical protein